MKRCLLAISLVAAILPGAAAQNFPDVPEHHWSNELFILTKYSSFPGGYPELQTVLKESIVNLRRFPGPGLPSHELFQPGIPARSLRELEEADRDIPEIVRYIVQYSDRFLSTDLTIARRDLIAIHGSIRAKIAVLKGSFGDVPEGHWAKAATQEMGAADLLLGDPQLAGSYAKLPANYLSVFEFAPSWRGHIESRRDFAAMLVVAHRKISEELDQWTKDTVGRAYLGSRPLSRAAAIADFLPGFKRLVSTYEKELASSGVDIIAMKTDLYRIAMGFERLAGRPSPAPKIRG